jgi:hypothetical protein
MSDLPEVTSVTEDGQLGAGFQSGDEYSIIMGCSSSGVASVPRLYSRPGDCVAAAGYGPGPDLLSHVVDKSKKPAIWIKLPSTVPGVNGAVDAAGAPTGTSVMTLTGLPYDSYQGKVLVATGGTLGVTGIVIDVSLDNGRNWIKGIALGVGSTYVIPNSGLTLNFAAGNLVATEYLIWTSTEPRWEEADFAAAFTALKGMGLVARMVGVAGMTDDADEVDELDDELDAYADEALRPMRALMAARAPEPTVILDTGDETVSPAVYDNLVWAAAVAPAKPTCSRAVGSWIADGIKPGLSLAVSGSDLNDGAALIVYDVSALVITFEAGTPVVDDADDDTVTIVGTDVLTWAVAVPPAKAKVVRGCGSWIDDGFHAGMRVVVTASDLNNSTFYVYSVAHKVLEFTTDVVADASDLDVVFTADEPEVDYIANLRAEFDSQYSPRVGLCAGMCLSKSSITPWEFRRSALWPAMAKAMQEDLQRSISRVKSGACDDTRIHDDNGDLVEHDERVVEGMIDGRFICLRTFATRGKNVYIALPKLLYAPGSDFVRLHLGLVFDKASMIVDEVLEGELNDDVALKQPSGYLTSLAAAKLEGAVNARIETEILGKERASSCVWTVSKTDDLTAPGAIVHGELAIMARGYLEKFETTKRFVRGS